MARSREPALHNQMNLIARVRAPIAYSSNVVNRVGIGGGLECWNVGFDRAPRGPHAHGVSEFLQKAQLSTERALA